MERAQLIARLSEELGMPVITVAASWHGDNAVDLAEEGARAFVSVLEAELEAARADSDSDAEHVGLFLLGRGGFPVFAEGVWRVLRGRGLKAHAIVPYRADGAFTLIALTAERCLLHPYASLGAYDRCPITAVSASPGQQQKLARRLMERIVGGTDAGLGARVARCLGAESLGSQLGLASDELERLGIDSQITRGDRADLVWDLYRAYESELDILEPPTPRYTPSDVADEVEFEPATGLCAAIIEGSAQSVHFELDTGSPDPETGVLEGRWMWEMLV
ncbi:MAG: hypothetical protein ACLFVJ_17985 [Persicimonas sp.]